MTLPMKAAAAAKLRAPSTDDRGDPSMKVRRRSATAATLIGPPSLEDGWDSAEEDAEDEAERPLVDVGEIEVEGLLEAEIAAGRKYGRGRSCRASR